MIHHLTCVTLSLLYFCIIISLTAYKFTVMQLGKGFWMLTLNTQSRFWHQLGVPQLSLPLEQSKLVTQRFGALSKH